MLQIRTLCVLDEGEWRLVEKLTYWDQPDLYTAWVALEMPLSKSS